MITRRAKDTAQFPCLRLTLLASLLLRLEIRVCFSRSTDSAEETDSFTRRRFRVPFRASRRHAIGAAEYRCANRCDPFQLWSIRERSPAPRSVLLRRRRNIEECTFFYFTKGAPFSFFFFFFYFRCIWWRIAFGLTLFASASPTTTDIQRRALFLRLITRTKKR